MYTQQEWLQQGLQARRERLAKRQAGYRGIARRVNRILADLARLQLDATRDDEHGDAHVYRETEILAKALYTQLQAGVVATGAGRPLQRVSNPDRMYIVPRCKGTRGRAWR